MNKAISLIEFLVKRDVSELIDEVAISSRIPYKFKIKALTSSSIDGIRKRCSLKDNKLDELKFKELVIVAGCLEPNFSDADFVSQVGVSSAGEALKKVLLPGEIENLSVEILKLSGYMDDNINDMVEEAKN